MLLLTYRMRSAHGNLRKFILSPLSLSILFLLFFFFFIKLSSVPSFLGFILFILSDRVFTRIGANDNIMAGRSTFMVELKETATILNQATEHSFVILDELGRGTSTFDGYSIAYAVLAHLAEKICCRTMFATHYHLLTDEYALHPDIAMKRMACFVEPARGDVTFLYKLEAGVCSRSYGMNVARMAQLPEPVIEAAARKAEEFEQSRRGYGPCVRQHHVFRQLMAQGGQVG